MTEGQALVVGGGKAPVFVVGDEVDLGELVADHLRAAVGAGVVDDEDLDLPVSDPEHPIIGTGLGLCHNGLQTAPEQIPYVPAYDDNTQVDHTPPMLGVYLSREMV